MATDKQFSFASFVEYGNNCFNNVSGNTPEIQSAFKTDLKKAIAHAGYPTKDEINVVDEINDFDMSATLSKVPEIVSGYMTTEKRSFDLPAGNDESCPATIKVVAVPEKTSTGEIKFGTAAGQTYSTTTKAHDEYSVKNRRNAFKEKK